MKYLIAGLGNPGKEYENTRHNIGYLIADALVASASAFESSRYAWHAQIKYKSRILHVIKPTTYMNLSGKAVKYWMEKEKIPVDRIMVVTDDIHLPFGKIRIRAKGSDGGHNGLKSIIASLGRNDFPRLRFGIGSNFSKGKQVEYVLGEWTEEERALLPEKIQLAVDAIHSFVTVGIARTMSIYNAC